MHQRALLTWARARFDRRQRPSAQGDRCDSATDGCARDDVTGIVRTDVHAREADRAGKRQQGHPHQSRQLCARAQRERERRRRVPRRKRRRRRHPPGPADVGMASQARPSPAKHALGRLIGQQRRDRDRRNAAKCGAPAAPATKPREQRRDDTPQERMVGEDAQPPDGRPEPDAAACNVYEQPTIERTQTHLGHRLAIPDQERTPARSNSSH